MAILEFANTPPEHLDDISVKHTVVRDTISGLGLPRFDATTQPFVAGAAITAVMAYEIGAAMDKVNQSWIPHIIDMAFEEHAIPGDQTHKDNNTLMLTGMLREMNTVDLVNPGRSNA